MVNINKLKAILVEKELNVESLANMIGIDKSTIYRRLNGGGEDFSIKEADQIAEALNLSLEEVNLIFFSQFVA